VNEVTAMEQILQFIGAVIAVGGTAAGAAYAIFMFTGKNWIEEKFAERLEAFKHEQNKELEEIRYHINAQFNRITKIHEKEIEVLPEAWVRLQKAVGQLQFFISPGRQYPNLDVLDEDHLEEYLSDTDFKEWEKKELREADKKVQKYHERIFWHELDETRQLARSFHMYFQENRIFLSTDLKELFKKVDDIVWESMTKKQAEHEYKDFKQDRVPYTKVREEIEPLVKDIEALVQQRLQYDETV